MLSPCNVSQELLEVCRLGGAPGLVKLMMSFYRKKEYRWVWKNIVDLKEPKPDMRTAFRVVIDNSWQGIAYLMLEVAGLDFIEAIQVKLTYSATNNAANNNVVFQRFLNKFHQQLVSNFSELL